MSKIKLDKKGRIRLTEAQIQKQIVDLLESKGMLVIQNRSTGKMAHLMDMGAKGSPDIIALCGFGLTFLIEVKDAKGKLTASQEAWHKKARALGHTVWVVRNLADLNLMLLIWGLE